MAYIRVDHKKLIVAADAVKDYRGLLTSKMQIANQIVDDMRASWRGDDAVQFQHQWDLVSAEGSVCRKMSDSLKSYEDYLRFASDTYKNAQIDAVNMADSLPRW